MLGTLEQVLGRVAPPVGSDSDGSLWHRLAQSLLDHPCVGGLGVGQGYEELVGGGQEGYEIRGTQGVERPANIFLLPATLYNQASAASGRSNSAETETSSRRFFSNTSSVCSSFLIRFLPMKSVYGEAPL